MPNAHAETQPPALMTDNEFDGLLHEARELLCRLKHKADKAHRMHVAASLMAAGLAVNEAIGYHEHEMEVSSAKN